MLSFICPVSSLYRHGWALQGTVFSVSGVAGGEDIQISFNIIFSNGF